MSRDPEHSFVVSDIHLSEAQTIHPRRPLWKRFKSRHLFVDGSVSRCFTHMRSYIGAGERAELILNGDIFDFDSVMAIPESPPFHVGWLERRRGLDAEERKSVFKISKILQDHPIFLTAVRDWLKAGHDVVFVIGNHDMELHWPAVQTAIRDALLLEPEEQDRLRFCEWFTLSGGDTLVEHGNQYDGYCVAANPVHPLISWRDRMRVRLPFGNIAGKLMLNGMGLFNPHVESSFILSVREYLTFFWRYVSRVQPFLAWTWFWTAVVTLVVTLREGFLPAVFDVGGLDSRVEEVAARSRAKPRLVRALQALRVHPAHYNPLAIARELWLDRALLLGALVFGTFQVFSFLNVFVALSLWWWLGFFVVLLAPFIFYARGINSDVKNYERGLRRLLPEAARLAGVKRVVLGHSHQEGHEDIGGVEVLNSGTWSPAYHDVECTTPYGRKCFVWLRPGESGRVAGLYEWLDPGTVAVPGPEPRASQKAPDEVRHAEPSGAVDA